MNIRLISSEKFYITQQDKVLYQSYLGTYSGIHIEAINCPDFVCGEHTLYLRGGSEHRDYDSVRVPRDMMKQVLTALSLCCIEHGVTLTVKL